MTTMAVRAWTNESDGHFFDGYVPGATLTDPVDLNIVADEADFYGVLDTAWAVGNRMATDADGKSWPATVRSLSVGDVLAIKVTGDRQWYWAVDPVGFRALQPEDVCDCGKGSYCPQYGIDFG